MKKLILALLFSATPAWAATTKYVSVTPTVDTSAYAAKDSIGGVMTFTNITCQGSNKGQLVAVMVSDKADNAVEYDLLTFNSSPGGTFTDQATVDPSDADLLLMNPVINIASTDHFSFNDNGFSSISSLGSRVQAYNAETLPGTLYAVLVSRGTPTYATSSDVTVTLGIQCD